MNGVEVSRDSLITSGKATKINITSEKSCLKADGHDVVYLNIDIMDDDENLVSDAAVSLLANISGVGILAGFGTGNPITEEVYSDNHTVTYFGHATAVIRSGYEEGNCTFSVSAEGLETVMVTIPIN